MINSNHLLNYINLDNNFLARNIIRMETQITGSTMTIIEVIGLIASIASLILSVGAIFLSVVFFKMSNEASKATTEA